MVWVEVLSEAIYRHSYYPKGKLKLKLKEKMKKKMKMKMKT